MKLQLIRKTVLMFLLLCLTLSQRLSELASAQDSVEPLGHQFKQEIVSRVAQLLEDEYVLPEQGRIAADEIRSRFAEGYYDEIDTLQMFANRLTGTLDVINDWHLWVNYYPQPIRDDFIVRQPTEEEAVAQQKILQRRNYGFEKVQRLDENIGYIEFRDFFYEQTSSERVLATAMEFVKNTDGLLIDLRRNGGGSPEMLRLFASYFADDDTLIGSLHYRKNNKVVEYWSLPEVDGPEYPDSKPVYVLISRNTFSAAEAFTYALQSLGRVRVIGEQTLGGAHASDVMRLHEHLMLSMPVAASVDPRTQSNWQGTGIIPDEEVPASDALDEAYRLILAELTSVSGLSN